MASTLTVSNVIQWAQAFTMGRSLSAFLNNEPAITTTNMLIQTIISPPFTWNWNRNTVTFLTTANVQDYSKSVATFGFIEKAHYIPAASVTQVQLASNVAIITANNSFNVGDLVTITGTSVDGGVFNVTNSAITVANATTFQFALTGGNFGPSSDTGTAVSGKQSEISTIANVLGGGSETGTPNSIAPQTDDNAGNITFRFLPVPDNIYQITITFQKRIPSLVSSLSGTFAPIPDHFAYIYEWGFLALMFAYSGDPRWAQVNQKFVTSLLGAAEGLSEDQKNAFQSAWLASITDIQSTSLKIGQGVQSRSV